MLVEVMMVQITMDPSDPQRRNALVRGDDRYR